MERGVEIRSWLEQARLRSNLTIADCARALCQSEISFLNRENNPGILTLNELRVLMNLFNEESKRLVREAFRDLGIL